ncbi:solute:sodium symporter family transporter [Photobacterium sp. ZSDE20]|uniref:Solute:sodium symporter family transporter n=1 Tax=Photobacterium pectinilyticum TaxID=2906793 RepID=A0ABT1ND77_9GAMM|nr:solute:sodium symporter family transporter [Photobacterium sp. ZSDE20]MCQ1061284.1 solute:sodium symporter family transporter [Photobacterium sp. ZSDE20]MDD1829785.1 solute:sodium symporter family transporter [Photobacterium sp. ZSDE20]
MNTWTIISFTIFTAMVAIVSWLITRKEDLSTNEGFFLGGRSLSGMSIGFSVLLTNWSAAQLIGLNAQGFNYGLSNMTWTVTLAIGAVIMVCFFLPFFIKTRITTIPQYLEKRFGPVARNVFSFCILINMAVVVLPTVVYAGALGLSKMFDVSALLNISDDYSLILTIILITIIGGVYAILGGLKAVVVSDFINGIGFFIGSILILFLALKALGDNSVIAGTVELITREPDKFNAVSPETTNMPLSVIFTGMILLNVYFCCANQVYIQRAIGARSLAEGQKGILFAAVMKVVSILFLVVPGIAAYHLYGNEGIKADEAYPLLVNRLLPDYLLGFFGAIVFGAVISTFNSTVNSCSTIFSINIYQPLIKSKKSGQDRTVFAGKVFGSLLILFVAIVAPLVQYAPDGLFMFMQEFAALFAIPMLLLILAGLALKKATAKTAIPGAVLYICLYLIFKFVITGWDIHFLHTNALCFVLGAMLIAVLTYLYPGDESVAEAANTSDKEPPVPLENWKYLRIGCISALTLVVATYALASPIGLAAPVEDIPINILRIVAVSIACVFAIDYLIAKLWHKPQNVVATSES